MQPTRRIAAILLAEGMLRVFRPYSPLGTGIELTWMRNNPNGLRKFFTIDPRIGFRRGGALESNRQRSIYAGRGAEVAFLRPHHLGKTARPE